MPHKFILLKKRAKFFQGPFFVTLISSIPVRDFFLCFNFLEGTFHLSFLAHSVPILLACAIAWLCILGAEWTLTPSFDRNYQVWSRGGWGVGSTKKSGSQ